MIVAKKDPRGSFSIDLPSASSASDARGAEGAGVNRSVSMRTRPSGEDPLRSSEEATISSGSRAMSSGPSPPGSSGGDHRNTSAKPVSPIQAIWETPSYSLAYPTPDPQVTVQDGVWGNQGSAAELIGRNLQAGWYQGEDGDTNERMGGR